jgi:hypothetical protein
MKYPESEAAKSFHEAVDNLLSVLGESKNL